MRLKVNLIEAINVIDKCVAEGKQVLSLIQEDSNPESIKEASVYFDRDDDCDREEVESWRGEFSQELFNGRLFLLTSSLSEWSEKCVKALREVFTDEAPVFDFASARGDEIHIYKYFELKDQLLSMDHSKANLEADVESKMKVLLKFYYQLLPLVTSPLYYLAEEAKLCYYDRVCSLTPGTNEAAICQYVFDGKKSLGQMIQFDDIWGYISGDLEEDFDKRWRNKTKQSAEEVNKKTRVFFGFSIFKVSKGYLYVNVQG